MKIPRNISGKDLIDLVKIYDYKVTKRSGSHIRLSTSYKGEHHITIPDHNPLKIGTLNKILQDISEHLKTEKKSLIETLFQ